MREEAFQHRRYRADVGFAAALIGSAEPPVTESRDGCRPLRAAPDTARKAA